MVGFGMLFLAAIPVGCYSALGTLQHSGPGAAIEAVRC